MKYLPQVDMVILALYTLREVPTSSRYGNTVMTYTLHEIPTSSIYGNAVIIYSLHEVPTISRYGNTVKTLTLSMKYLP